MRSSRSTIAGRRRIQSRGLWLWLALSGIVSCAPFTASGNDGAPSTSGADAASDTGGRASPDAAIMPDARSGTGAVCNALPGAALCFDFDGLDPFGGLTLTRSGGTVSLAPTFGTGSAPSSMMIQSTTMHGNVSARANSIDLTTFAKRSLTLQFLFRFTVVPTATEHVASLDFSVQSFPLTLDSTGAFLCGGTARVLAPGVHRVEITMVPNDVGFVSAYRCTVDSSGVTSQAVPSAASLVVELGNADSGTGNFAVSYDDVFLIVQ